MSEYKTPDERNEELLERIRATHEEALLIQETHNIGRLTGEGEVDSKWQYLLGGLNLFPNTTPVPTAREMQGLVLFTRPELNLTKGNIAGIRYLSHLLNTDTLSVQHAVRRILDPLLQRMEMVGKTGEPGWESGPASKLVDPYTPYISLLSNTIRSMSQPPDVGTSTYASPEGILKEQWLMNEGTIFTNGRYDLTMTFDNPRGAMVLSLFHTWLLYISYLRVGISGGVVPYSHATFFGIMDYFTRVERYKFDETGRYVVQWFHTGASYPTNLSIGAGFSYNRDEAYDQENKTLSVQFACVGAVYQDPIQLHEFNLRHERFNPTFKKETRAENFKRIDHGDRQEFNYVGYPRINLSTLEMEWWVPNAVYDSVVGKRDPLVRSYGGGTGSGLKSADEINQSPTSPDFDHVVT